MNTNQKTAGTAKKYWRYLKIFSIVAIIIYWLLLVLMMYFASSGEWKVADTIIQFMVIGAIVLTIPTVYLRVKMGAGYRAGREDEVVREEALREISDSGTVVESVSTSGYMEHFAGDITVDVYPAGFIAYGDKLIKNPVRWEEVIEITYKEDGTRSGIEIKHNAPAGDSPIFLSGVTLDSPVGTALTNMVGPSKVR